MTIDHKSMRYATNRSATNGTSAQIKQVESYIRKQLKESHHAEKDREFITELRAQRTNLVIALFISSLQQKKLHCHCTIQRQYSE